jgi:positive regulator of sigma E activity
MQEFWGLLGMSIAYFFSFLGLILAYISYRKHRKVKNSQKTQEEK